MKSNYLLVETKYFRAPGYLEIDIDVGSSSVARAIFGHVSTLTKSICVDLAFLIQGNSEEELPERILGGVRLAQVILIFFVFNLFDS